MPPFRVIGSLNSICIEWVWRWLFYCLKQEATPQNRIQQREYVISTLNANIRQQLLNHVCKTHMYQVHHSSKCFLLELLGDKSTSCVDFTESGFCYVDEVFQLYRTLTFSLILNLGKLGVICNVNQLSDRKHVPDLNVTFYRVFNQMHNLRWLTMRGLADSTILGILSNNCPNLEYLDVANSSFVTDEGIARLILRDPAIINGRSLEQMARMDLDTTELCKSLYFLSISGTEITMIGVVIVLRFLPKLRSLGGDIDCGSISHAIELIQPGVDNGGEAKVFQFDILSDFVLSPRKACLLSRTCPKVTKFTTGIRSMSALHHLHPLQSLTIEDVSCEPWCIYDYLGIRGSTLKELILPDNINFPLDLSWIIELTPNLERLQSNIMVEEGYEIPNWKTLRVANVMISSSKVLLVLLTHTPSLRELDLTFCAEPYSETSDCLNDDLFIYIAVSGGLKDLEKLIIRDCALSSRGIDCLLIHCPELWYFAYLIFWRNVSQEDIQRFRSEAIENNWKLRLILREDWEGDIMKGDIGA